MVTKTDIIRLKTFLIKHGCLTEYTENLEGRNFDINFSNGHTTQNRACLIENAFGWATVPFGTYSFWTDLSDSWKTKCEMFKFSEILNERNKYDKEE